MGKGFTGPRQAEAQDLKVVSAIQEIDLGAEGRDSDGNVYTYVQAGASQLDHGKLQVAEAIVANHTNLTVAAAAAVGDRQITVTLGATAVTQDQYAEGYITINAGSGVGYTYKIKGNAAANASASLTVYTVEPLAAALTTASSKASIQKNPAKSVAQSTTLGKAIGVPLVDIPALNYGWAQRTGLAAVLAQGAVTKGFSVEQDVTTAGAIKVSDALTDQIVGVANEALVSTEYRTVTIEIAS